MIASPRPPYPTVTQPTEVLKFRPGSRILNKPNLAEWILFKRILGETDVMILPTRADFSPNVIAEAYAFGLPVVAAGVGAIPEMIQRGRTGFMVRQGSVPGAYVEPLMRLARYPELVPAMRSHARTYFNACMRPSVAGGALNALLECAREMHKA